MAVVIPYSPSLHTNPYASSDISLLHTNDPFYHLVFYPEKVSKLIKEIANQNEISVIDIRLGEYLPVGVNDFERYAILREIIMLIMRYLQNTTHITTFKIWFSRCFLRSKTVAYKINHDILNHLVCMLSQIRSVRHLFIQGYKYEYLHNKIQAYHGFRYSCNLRASLNFNSRQHALRTISLFEMMTKTKYVHISPFKGQYNLVRNAFYIVKKKGKEHSFFQYEFYHDLSKDLYGLKCDLIDRKDRKTKYVAYKCVDYIVRCSHYVQDGLSLKRIRIRDDSDLDYYNTIPANHFPK